MPPLPILRLYQSVGKADVYAAWNTGVKHALFVLPTGGGKTVFFCDIIREMNVPTVAIAHRRELVTQMSRTLAANGIRHRVIGPPSVIKACVAIHMMHFGESYYNANADVAVAGVDTLIKRQGELSRWRHRVKLIVQDEAHHLVKGNKWGQAIEMFPNARLLGVTATPERADGKGLGAHSDGYFEKIVIGPTMRELIEMGYLTDYEVYAPPNDLDLSDVAIGASGDYNQKGAAKAVKRSRILGDVVKHYLLYAPGKLGVTFVPDVESGIDVAQKFNAAGVRAEMVSAKTPDLVREDILRRFANREIMQLVNVDLFGEGFDLPAIEVVSLARPTESNSLFVQQLGRALRVMEGKDKAIIIDHVNNYVKHCTKHGRPDRRRNWSLDRRNKKSSGVNDAIPMTVCVACTHAYERVLHVCPYCGSAPIIGDRSSPEFVDGDLVLLDDAVLAKLLGEIKAIEEPLSSNYVRDPRTASIAKNHEQRREVHSALKTVIDWWGAYQRAEGRDDRESYKRFYYMFGIDILSCQTLAKSDAIALAEKISIKLTELEQ